MSTTSRTASRARLLALTAGFLLILVFVNGLELPFLPHKMSLFVDHLGISLQLAFNICVASIVTCLLARGMILFLKPSVLAFMPKAPEAMGAFQRWLKEHYPGLVLIVSLLLIGAGAVGYRLYRQLDADTRARVNYVNPPVVGEGSISEIGYIYFGDGRLDFERHSRDVWWQVKIPSTGKTYYCTWIDGSPEFKRGDGVKLIHRSPDLDFSDYSDYSGYIVGLDGGRKGKYAGVQALTEDDLRSQPELDSPQD